MRTVRSRCFALVVAVALGHALPGQQCPTFNLVQGTPQTVSCTTLPTSCSLTPVQGQWNVLGVTSASDWNVGIGGATSNLLQGQPDYLVANGTLGTVTAGPATVSDFYPPNTAGIQACTVQHVTSIAIPVNALFTASFSATHVVKLFAFEITAAGVYSVSVGGTTESALHWDLFGPGTDAAWRPRNSRIAEGAMSATQTVQLGLGSHAFVVVRQGAIATGAAHADAMVACGPSPLTLVPGTPAQVQAPCRFTESPATLGRFNVVGVASVSDWDVGVTWTNGASMASANPGTTSDFLIRDYSAGNSTSTIRAAFTAAPGSSNGYVLHEVAPPLTLGTVQALTWNWTRPFRAFEFVVPVAGDYSFLTTGPPTLAFGIHGSTPALAWRARSDSEIFSAGMNSGAANRYLAAGRHALVVTGDGGIPGFPLSHPCTIRIVPDTPVIAALTPGQLLAGGPATTITLSGSHFNSTSEVRWNNTPLTTIFVGPTELQAAVGASLIANPGTAQVQVWNQVGLPAGSNILNADVVGPYILSINPGELVHVTAPPFTHVITIQGTGFTPGAVVHANGLPQPTWGTTPGVLFSSIGPNVPQALVRGGIAINVVNFGALPSNTVAVSVGPGGNRGTIVRSPLEPAPGSAYGLNLEGGLPGQPLTLVVSLAETQPLTAWPTPAADFVLGLDFLTMAPITDGIGVFGPASGASFAVNPAGTVPYGEFQIGGFFLPSTPLGVDLSVQAVYLDPSSPVSFRLTWTRYPESL